MKVLDLGGVWNPVLKADSLLAMPSLRTLVAPAGALRPRLLQALRLRGQGQEQQLPAGTPFGPVDVQVVGDDSGAAAQVGLGAFGRALLRAVRRLVLSHVCCCVY